VIARTALLAVLCFAGAARAEPEPEPAPLDLTGARILASPGWPGALKPFLPPGREVEPLALPLPPGPLLVLGLPDQDPVAREVGETLPGWKPLHGGYVVDARREGDRALAVILAADAAALAAARFELETFTPSGKEAEPRSVEFQKPDEQGGVRIASGRRSVKPRYRIRGAAGLGPGETLLDIAAAHADRMWVPPDVSDRDLALLREHGVEPVAWTRNEDSLQKILTLFLDLQRRGVRHFALDCRRSTGSGDECGPEAQLAGRIADALRPGGLKELLVFRVDSDAARKNRTGKGLLDIPEAVLGWTGPNEQPLEITRDQAWERRKQAGVPVVLVETWMEATDGGDPRLPSGPHGRAGDLGDVLDGIVFLPGPGSAGALAATWAPPPDADTTPELAELLGACAQNAKDGSMFLLESAACLEQTLLGRYADPPWLRGLPQRLRETAASLPPSNGLVLARLTTEPLQVDGRLGEAAWGEADWHRVGDVDLAAVSDGHRLVFALRFVAETPPYGLWLEHAVEGTWIRHALLPLSGDHLPGQTIHGVSKDWGWTNEVSRVRLEVAFSHYALRGDPYPTRYFPFDLEVKRRDGIHHLGRAKPVDPSEPEPKALGGLLIVR
jgi:hypothetical protein